MRRSMLSGPNRLIGTDHQTQLEASNRASKILLFLREVTEYTPLLAVVTRFNWFQNRHVGTYQNILEVLQPNFWHPLIPMWLPTLVVTGFNWLQKTRWYWQAGSFGCKMNSFVQFSLQHLFNCLEKRITMILTHRVNLAITFIYLHLFSLTHIKYKFNQ